MALAADAQGYVLQALVNAGVTEGHRSDRPDPLLRALDRFNLAIALGTGSEPGTAPPADLGPWPAVFTALAADAQGSVLKALANYAIVTANLRWRQPHHLALALPMVERQDSALNLRALLGQQDLHREALSPAADLWLTQVGAGMGTALQRPRQAADALRLARQRLALRRPDRRAVARHMSRLASATQGLASPGAVNPMPPALARHLALQQGWPITLDSLPHWLLALAARHCAHLLPSPLAGTTPFDLDVAALARAQCWFKLRSADGTLRQATGLAQQDAGDQALLLRYRPAPDSGLLWKQWLSAWLDHGATGAADVALRQAWWQLQPALQRMAAWHQARLPTPPQQAWAVARHACLTGQADVFVADTLAAQAR